MTEFYVFFFQAEDGIRDVAVTGVQTCALPICNRYIIVAMDYFTRWPEAKAVRSANSEKVANFIYENIICRFGAPRVIQSDQRSEERRVGKECRSRWSSNH